MRSHLVWSDKIPERDGQQYTVYDLVFSPDGTQLVAGVGNRVLLYDANDGTLLHSLKGHKGNIYTVDYSYNGKRFASGGADNIVIIWTDKAEGILKYTHNDAIQKLAYNPQSQSLASCAVTDFGIWAPEQKSVTKHKVVSKILSASWTKDGQYLALGLLNGLITIRDKFGDEKQQIEKNGPIWALCWTVTLDESLDLLAVGCWDRTLSFYHINGTPQGKPRKLNFSPTGLTYFSKEKYLLMVGSSRKAGLYTRDGVLLSNICDLESWIWSIKNRPKSNQICIGCENGSLAIFSLVFGTVHGIYQERYAFRENMTDVVVQHLMTEQKVRIKTRECVKKISVFRDRLAVQLAERIIIYELTNERPKDMINDETVDLPSSILTSAVSSSSSSNYDMHYRVKTRISLDLPCSLLVVSSENFILCQKQKLQQFNFNGKKEREWVMEAMIRYIKVTGGARGKEGLLIGLKDGSVWQIYLSNPFPIHLITQSSAITCLDISANHEKLAVVDDAKICRVYDLVTKELVYEEKDANSVAWNTEFEDMLCFAGKGQLKIKTGLFPVHSQRMQGFVVGFTGSKIFCLNSLTVQAFDVPQSAPLYRYLEQGDFEKAYLVSCLGVTESDWRLLAWEALQKLNFKIAKKGFARLRDVRLIDLVNTLEHTQKQLVQQLAPNDSTITLTETKIVMRLRAEIMAYQGRFPLAAKLFSDIDEYQSAIKMYVDLRMWDEAKKFAAHSKSMDISKLVADQAKWAEEVQDWRAAVEMYMACGNLKKAVEITGQNGWYNELLELVHKIDVSDVNGQELLSKCASYFLKAEKFTHARDVYLKISDFDSLLRMHIQLQEWDEAIRLAQKQQNNSQYIQDVYVPYAEWLISQDRFEEALKAYTKAKRLDHSSHLLKRLIENAIDEKRFSDASYYYWVLSEQILLSINGANTNVMQSANTSNHLVKDAMQCDLLSKIYYAYSLVYSYTDEPFTTHPPEALFHAAQYILNEVSTKGMKAVDGLSIGNVYFTLGHHSLLLETYKLARHVFEKILQIKLRPEWQEQVELTAITLQTKPYLDKEEHLPVDYRSSTTNPLLNPNGSGDVCVNSGHPFIRSFISFEVLPLVEFRPASEISEEEAEQWLLSHPLDSDFGTRKVSECNWRETGNTNGSQTLSLVDNNDTENERKLNHIISGTELFELAINKQGNFTLGVGHRSALPNYRVLQIDEQTLRALRPSEVFIIKYPAQVMQNRYYKNMIPDIKIHLCQGCRRFFYEDEFEFEYLKKNECPCCRSQTRISNI